MADLPALRDEIVNDPNGIGYKGADGEWGRDQPIADLINDRANGATFTRNRIEPAELRASLDLTEWMALTGGQRGYLQMLLGGGVIDATSVPVLVALTSIFEAGSVTRAALLAKIQRQGSRAEVLWGEDARIMAGDVGRAFNLIGA